MAEMQLLNILLGLYAFILKGAAKDQTGKGAERERGNDMQQRAAGGSRPSGRCRGLTASIHGMDMYFDHHDLNIGIRGVYD